MKIKIIKASDHHMLFELSNANPAIANAIRRTIISEVPTMAIDYIVVIENNTMYFDEHIAHTLGMIPLTTDLKKYNLPEECKCGGSGCPLCTTRLILEVEAIEDNTIIYSGDLKPQDPTIKPVRPDIPLFKLNKQDRIVLEAIARLGRGKQHSKWQPVGPIGYKYYPTVEIDNSKCNLCGECVKVCSRRALALKDAEIVLDPLRCSLCKLCVETCDVKAISLKMDDTRFIFQFETTGALEPQQILQKAIEIIVDKLESFKKQVAIV